MDYGDPVSEEDRVVQLLTSLPESFNMLVTALEANPDVPSMETVTERLLHEERKKGQEETVTRHTKAMMAHNSFGQKKKFTCRYCGKPVETLTDAYYIVLYMYLNFSIIF